MKGAARCALSFIPLFGFAILVFGQFASVIVMHLSSFGEMYVMLMFLGTSTSLVSSNQT
jgi:hypothetical protein